MLRQPFSIAILASLGIHGALWFLLPFMPTGNPIQMSNQKSVGVVELTPLEQLRLPDTLSGSTTRTLPSPGSQSPLWTKPMIPTKPNPPASPVPPPAPPLLDSGSLYNIPIIPPPPVTILPPLNLPPIPEPPQPVKRRPVQPPPPKASGPTPPATNPAEPGQPSATPSPTEPVRPEKIPAAAIAALRERQEQLRQTGDRFSFNQANTTEGEFNQNLAQLGETANQLSAGNLKKDWQRQKDITDLYPKEACPLKLKGTTWVGAVFTPEGKLAEKPTVLLSSGYAGLDESAVVYVANQTIPAKDQFQALIFPFQFEYSETVCPPDNSEKAGSGG